MGLPDSKKLLAKITEKWPAKVLSLVAAIIFFIFHHMSGLEERFFSVPLRLEISNDLVPSSPYPKNIRISLRGDANSIFPVNEADVEAYLDLTKYREPGSYKAPVQVRKTGTALETDSLEIGVDPMEITITLDTKISKTVSLTPDLDGSLEDGYELVSYTLNPPKVLIEGPTGLVNSVEELSTEAVDLEGRNSDFSVQIHIINENPLLMIRGDGMAEFKGYIRELIMIRSFGGIPIAVSGLDGSFQAELPVKEGGVRVEGPQNTLERFDAALITLTVDCSQILSPGTYTIPLNAAVPEGITVSRLEPAEIQVLIGAVEGSGEGEEEEP
ncbi:MAG: hypothetical protein LBQ44_01605 [Treponema sp.]|nr:hypothetical protein [Treponema sp.]